MPLRCNNSVHLYYIPFANHVPILLLSPEKNFYLYIRYIHRNIHLFDSLDHDIFTSERFTYKYKQSFQSLSTTPKISYMYFNNGIFHFSVPFVPKFL